MADIQINIDQSDMEKKLKKLKNIKNGGPKAVMRAMNRTVTGMRTDAGREIRASYTIKKQSEIRDKLEIEKASASDLSIALRSRGRPIRSIKFRHRKNRKPGKAGTSPAFLHVKKSEQGGHLSGKDNYSKAFMATMPNGTQGIFQRTGAFVNRDKNKNGNLIKARTGKSASGYSRRTDLSKGRKGRENIEEVTSPGVADMLREKKVSKAIRKKATKRFYNELDHQVKYLLEQQK